MRELGDPVDEIWGDESVRQSYNFAPGYTGLVYRGVATDAANGSHNEKEQSSKVAGTAAGNDDDIRSSSQHPGSKFLADSKDPKYVLQAMRWGVCLGFLMDKIPKPLNWWKRADKVTNRPHSILDKAETTIWLSYENN